MAAFKITDQTLRIAALATGVLAVLAALAPFALNSPRGFRGRRWAQACSRWP